MAAEEIPTFCHAYHNPEKKGSKCIPVDVRFIFEGRKNEEVIIEWAKSSL